MKLYYIILILLLQTYTINVLAQETAVIPYKIANPTENFTIETGKEYAKLVSLGAMLSRDVSFIPHNRTDAALKKLSLNSQRIITEENLRKIGRMVNADNVLIGTILKSKGRYTSESILYSIRDREIVSKSRVSSGNLLKLAEEELNEIFYNSPRKIRITTDKQIDAVILTDLSYKVSADWTSIKDGIKKFADNISKNWNLNTQIYIIPFADKYRELHKYSASKSLQSLNEKLNQIKPAGSASAKILQNALNHSVKNIPWRKNSEKILIIISNSENIDGNFLEQYALTAKSKNIAINTISLGLLRENALETLKQFSVVGAGHHYSAAYHQRMFNEKGDKVDVFYQEGRIFYSLVYEDTWKGGLFEDNRRKQSIIQKPKSFLSEVLYDEQKYNVHPYNLKKFYPALSSQNIINSETLENNIESIMNKIGSEYENTFSKQKYKKAIAKVQISDGNISLWIQIKDEKDLKIVTENMSAKNYFPLGAVIKKGPNDPYGIIFHPDLYITELGKNYIPDLVKTNINKIIKDPDYYVSNGLLTPPVWFIDIKVEKIENLRREYDVRELGR
ncbi:MAG: VWA domain-containing protein [Spirochaetes bacterium]|nr:VWA domain-containing protein [Spirochaetota bacterium]